MGSFLVVGRVLFVVIFVISGVQKLADVAGTAQLIATHVPIPAAFADLGTTLESATGLPLPQIMAILAGLTEVIGGLLIAFNIATRPIAIIMALFTIVVTAFFHNFWTMTGAEYADNMVHALKNVSIVGGCLVLAAIGSRQGGIESDRL